MMPVLMVTCGMFHLSRSLSHVPCFERSTSLHASKSTGARSAPKKPTNSFLTGPPIEGEPVAALPGRFEERFTVKSLYRHDPNGMGGRGGFAPLTAGERGTSGLYEAFESASLGRSSDVMPSTAISGSL